jgi:hypothetical protein
MSRALIASAQAKIEKAQSEEVVPVWIRLATAAALIDTSPKALAMRVSRGQVPADIVRRLGRTVLIHRAKLLTWLEGGGDPSTAPLSRVP